jgi:hypothetical protein
MLQIFRPASSNLSLVPRVTDDMALGRFSYLSGICLVMHSKSLISASIGGQVPMN